MNTFTGNRYRIQISAGGIGALKGKVELLKLIEDTLYDLDKEGLLYNATNKNFSIPVQGIDTTYVLIFTTSGVNEILIRPMVM